MFGASFNNAKNTNGDSIVSKYEEISRQGRRNVFKWGEAQSLIVLNMGGPYPKSGKSG